MRLTLITAPTVEAVTDDEVRSYLRVTGAEYDAQIARLIKTARKLYEQFTNQILVTSTWDLYIDCFPSESYIALPNPLTSITSVTYTDTAKASQTWAAANYVVDIYSPIVARLALAYGISWPSTYDEINAVKVRFVAGYAGGNAVPDDIKDGLYLCIEQLFDGVDRRAAYEALWWPYRRIPV